MNSRIWILYYLFVRKIYTRRWNGFVSSAGALAFACIFIQIQFLITLFDFFTGWNLMNNIFSRGLPLGPIVQGVLFFLFLLLFMLFNKKASRTEKIAMIKKSKQFKKSWSVLYILCSGLAFAGIIFLMILQR